VRLVFLTSQHLVKLAMKVASPPKQPVSFSFVLAREYSASESVPRPTHSAAMVLSVFCIQGNNTPEVALELVFHGGQPPYTFPALEAKIASTIALPRFVPRT